MRRIMAASALAAVLVAVGVVVQRDSARAVGCCVLYALTSPNPTADYTFGSAVATGDVNGDGRADAIVGSPETNKAHVFSGSDGALLYSLAMPSPVAGARFGASVDAGDVNGDGNADVVVGAPNENVGGNSGQGRVYVFSGSDGTLLRALDTANPSSSAGFGSAVAAGDVNGDGSADLIVAAPTESVPGSGSTGRVYVFSGADGSLLYTHETSPADVGTFGTDVTSGDVNGDGKSNIIVGGWSGTVIAVAPYVSVYSGIDGSLLHTLLPPVYARFDTEFGSSLATGDVNGDGIADVIVGDPAVGAFVAGPAAYVFDGASGSLIYTLTNPYPNPGETPYFGTAVAAGDVDGDGRVDAIVGMLPDPITVPNVGRVFAFSGADGSVLDALDAPNPNIQWGNSFGDAVAAGGVTGGGKDSVIVGAPDFASGEPGLAYVIAREADGDGCADADEPLLVPPTDPLNPWDFYSVPVPALFAAQYPRIDFRDGVVSAADAEAVFAYFKAGSKAGATLYEQDLNRNGVKDGYEYDRSFAGPARSGPPDGAVTPQDAQLAFAQFKMAYHC